MHNAPQVSRGVLFFALVCVALIVPRTESRAGQLPLLTGDGIKKLITGATVHLHTPLGTVIPVVYGADGSLKGKAGFVSFYLGSASDRGRWWVSGSKLCQKWKIWFKGKTNCLAIRRKGARFHWDDGKGERGVATIVSRAVVASRPKTKKKRSELGRSPAGVGGPVPAVRNPEPNQPVGKTQAAPKRSATPARSARAASAPLSLEGMRRPRNARRRPARAAARGTDASTPVETTAPARRNGAADSVRDTSPTFQVVHVRQDDVLNVRRSPSPDSQIIGAIAPGAGGVQIVGSCRDYWCRVVHANGRGWVNRAYLAMETPRSGGRAVQSRSSIRYRVVRVEAGDVLNIRRAPSMESPVASTVPANAGGISITGPCRGEWCPVVRARVRGWVNRYFIEPVTVSSSRASW